MHTIKAIAIPAPNQKRVKFDAKKRIFYALWFGDASSVNVIQLVVSYRAGGLM